MKKMTLFMMLFSILLSSCGQPSVRPDLLPQPLETLTPTAFPAASSSFESSPCPFTVPEVVTEGEDVVCGWVSVPEEHAHPQGKTIRLRVAVIKSSSRAPEADPLVIESGGPGVSTIVSALGILLTADPDLRARRDMILIEQRGTRYSDPFLMCDALFTLAQQQVTSPGDPAEEAADRLEAAETCRQQLESQGVRLAAYNSLENAADILWVVSALGYDQFNFYGISYATLLAQHLLRMAPGRLRSVIMDAPVPLGMDYAAQAPQNTQQALNLFFEHCVADAACHAAYPELKTHFTGLVASLNAQPRTIHFDLPAVDVTVNGDTLIWMAYQHLLYGTISMLPAWLDALTDKEGDEAFFTSLGVSFLISTPLNGMTFSTRCADEAGWPAAQAKMDGINPQVARVIQKSMNIQDICEIWPHADLPEEASNLIHSEVPTLIFSGEFDPVTPLANAQVISAGLPNSQVYQFPGLGHGAFMKHRCPTVMALAFLDKPDQAVDSSCIAGMEMKFVIPTTTIQLQPFSDPDNGIQGLLPVGWGRVQAGLYLYMDGKGKSALLEVSRLPDIPLEQQMASWLPGLGIERFPESTGTRETAAFTWELYTFPGAVAGLGSIRADVAMAKMGTAVYYVGLYVPPEDYASLHEQVFLPVVDALTLLK